MNSYEMFSFPDILLSKIHAQQFFSFTEYFMAA